MHDLLKKSVQTVHFQKKEEVLCTALKKKQRSFEKAALVFLRISQAACLFSVLIVLGSSLFMIPAFHSDKKEQTPVVSIDNDTPFAFIRYASLIEEKRNEN